MNIAESSGHGCVATVAAQHATGHTWAADGTLLRVDCERGTGWVASRYDRHLRLIQQVRGSDEEVHRVAARWARGRGRS
ncbi:hypothetical protein DVS77_09795 [Mycolicibacterium moriokaense]|nr:hypothetical protein DVS77_09795 [Mycolicibacterium moriokaense]